MRGAPPRVSRRWEPLWTRATSCSATPRGVFAPVATWPASATIEAAGRSPPATSRRSTDWSRSACSRRRPHARAHGARNTGDPRLCPPSGSPPPPMSGRCVGSTSASARAAGHQRPRASVQAPRRTWPWPRRRGREPHARPWDQAVERPSAEQAVAMVAALSCCWEIQGEPLHRGPGLGRAGPWPAGADCTDQRCASRAGHEGHVLQRAGRQSRATATMAEMEPSLDSLTIR